MLPKGIKHVKAVRAGGKAYFYYVTARLNPDGRPILARLPAQDDPTFWQTYAAYESARVRQSEVLTVPALVRMFYRSPKWAKLAPKSQRGYTAYLDKLADNYGSAPAGKMAACCRAGG